MRRGIHKLTTWLVLVAYMLSGVSPAQQLVVCLEPDGSVVLEAAEDGACTPCGPEESSQEVEQLAAECCPCVDIPLPMQGEEAQAKPKASDAQISSVAVLPPCFLAIVAWVEQAKLAFTAGDQPRQAQRLELIRTVILRV